MTQWNSLFCKAAFDVVEALQDTLVELEYTLYNAFDLIPGMAYADTIKSFVAPIHGQWIQILVDDSTELDDLELLAETLSKHGLVLLTHLDLTDATVTLYQDGVDVDLYDGLLSYLLDGKTGDDLQRAISGTLPLPTIETAPDEQSQILAIDDLPPEIRMMAQGVKLSNAQKMFQRMTGNLMGRGQAQDAQNMLNRDTLDWNGQGGMQIRGVLSCLLTGDGWLSPDFATVRDAYQRHIRKQRRPDARLYPGDQQMMDAVPDALAYTPVYGGQ